MNKMPYRAMKMLNFETNVPRCGTCIHVRVYQDKVKKQTTTVCDELKFKVARFSRCDLWESKKGEVLE